MNALEIRDLCKSYPGFSLQNLNLTLPQGCIMGLIGENGAGKSTTIKLILEMVRRDSGSIRIFGKDNTENISLIKEDIGVVLDEVGFPECLTVKQIGNIMKNTYRNWDSVAYKKYVRELALPENKEFKDFSRGMKMKLGITPAAIRYDYPLILSEKTVSILAYSLETILAEKYETIIRRNIGTTRARDFYDLYMLCRQHWDEIRFEVLHDAVQHTAKKRGSLEELYDWKDILKEIREEPQLYTLWRNYVAENKYAEGLEFHVILDIVDEIAEMLNF